MSVLGRLAGALGRNDERPNVELAGELAASGDTTAIAELAEALATAPVAVQNDAIKVLHEIGALKPELIAPHAPALFALLKSKNNRNVWGVLQAIDAITRIAPKSVAAQLDAILAAADAGSVIAKDKAVSILAQLAKGGHATAMMTLIARLEDAAPNQLPMYAEMAAPTVGPAHAKEFRTILEARLATLPQSAKRARIEKILRALR